MMAIGQFEVWCRFWFYDEQRNLTFKYIAQNQECHTSSGNYVTFDVAKAR